MALQLISEKLLETEVKKRKENPQLVEENELFYSLCEKELLVLSKLKIDEIDMRGETEELKERLERYHVYFIESKEFESMKEKARRFDLIMQLVGELDANS